MSDLSKLKKILDNQTEQEFKSGDWPRLEYKEKHHKEEGIRLVIDSLQVGFFFSERGRLIGAYNWKE
jgi:hypothetical protein